MKEPLFIDSPIHPGEILNEEFLEPLHISQTKLAADLGVPYRRINEIVLGKRAITADTALLLARYFKNSPQVWLNIQMRYDLECRMEPMKAQLARVRSMR